jgi:hypothetical protein
MVVTCAAVVLAFAVCASGASAATFELPYGGGPVLHSSSPYLVFWTPPGESIPASSEQLMGRFFADVAADSGKSSNVYGVLRQYYDRRGFADYRQRFDPARQVIIDRHPYPPRDTTLCPDVSTFYPTCISQPQIRNEVQRLITAEHLPDAGGSSGGELRSSAPIYFVVTPADVMFCNGVIAVTRCTDKRLGGYHDASLLPSGRVVLYAVIATNWARGVPLPPGTAWPCAPGGGLPPQEPNHDPADCTIPLLGHEDGEAITDPLYNLGWSTPKSIESGDECELTGPFDPAKAINPNSYLPTLGGSASAGTLYDQLINGHPYDLQSQWSNGLHTCAQRPSPGSIAPRFTLSRVHRVATSRRFQPAASTSTHHLSSATWNFGDGSQTKFLFGTQTLSRVTHRYKKPGQYTVTLALVDNTGNLKTTTKHLTIPHP